MPVFIVIPYAYRTQCSFVGASSIVVESALVSRCGQSLAVSPSLFQLHWVPSCGQHDRGAAIGELGWPRFTPQHGELAWGLGVVA